MCAGAEPLGAELPPAKASISGSSKPDPAGRAALLATYFVPSALLRCAIGARMCLAIVDALCGGAGSGGTGGKGPTRGVGIAFRLDSNHPFLDDVRLAAPSGAKVGAWGGGGGGGGSGADGEGEGEGGDAAAGQRGRGDSVTEVTKEVVAAVLTKAGEGVSSLVDRVSATMAKAGQMQRNQFSAGRADTADAAGAGGGAAEGVSLDDAAAAAAEEEEEQEQGSAGAKAAAVASAVGATVGAAAAKGAANAASAAAGAATAASGALRGLREKVATAMAPKDDGGGDSATAADADTNTNPAAAAAAAAASGDDAAADAEAAGDAASTPEEGGEGASVEEGGAEAPRKALIADGDL